MSLTLITTPVATPVANPIAIEDIPIAIPITIDSLESHPYLNIGLSENNTNNNGKFVSKCGVSNFVHVASGAYLSRNYEEESIEESIASLIERCVSESVNEIMG